MSKYSKDEIERRAKHFENAGILDIASMLREYAAHLAAQAEGSPTTNTPEVSSKVVDAEPPAGVVPSGLYEVAKRNLRSLIVNGSDDKELMLKCWDEL